MRNSCMWAHIEARRMWWLQQNTQDCKGAKKKTLYSTSQLGLTFARNTASGKTDHVGLIRSRVDERFSNLKGKNTYMGKNIHD